MITAKQAAKLRRLISARVVASVDLASAGAQPPEDAKQIRADWFKATKELSNYIRELIAPNTEPD